MSDDGRSSHRKSIVILVVGCLFTAILGCTGAVKDDTTIDAGNTADAGNSADAGIGRCAQACSDVPNCEEINGQLWDDSQACFSSAFAACDVPTPQPDAAPNWIGPDGGCWAGEGGNWAIPASGFEVPPDGDPCLGRSATCE